MHWPRVIRGIALILLLAVLSSRSPGLASSFSVSPGGSPSGKGTPDSPWDLASALAGKQPVAPGDVIWLGGGSYVFPDRTPSGMGYQVRLAGTDDLPIQVRGMGRQRVTIDGGLSVAAGSSFIWLRDLELMVSENLHQSRQIDSPGSTPRGYGRPWGGLNVYGGKGCKFINLVIHDNAQGASWWSGSTESELYGCIFYDNGWQGPDRGHGHAIYTQNKEGTKTIADCIMCGGYGYSLHAYGSSRADVDNYLVTRNICFEAGSFLIGGGKPSRNIRVLTNYLYGVSMQIGYNAPSNINCEILGNRIVNGSLSINNYRKAIREGNEMIPGTGPRPNRVQTVLLPNRYDSKRAHLAVWNCRKDGRVSIPIQDFLKPGERFALFEPRGLFGKPLVEGVFESEIPVAMTTEFGAFILIKE